MRANTMTMEKNRVVSGVATILGILTWFVTGCETVEVGSGEANCESSCDKLVNECQSGDSMEACLQKCSSENTVFRSEVVTELKNWVQESSCETLLTDDAFLSVLTELTNDIPESVVTDFVNELCQRAMECNTELSQETCLTTFGGGELGNLTPLFKALKPETISCILEKYNAKDCLTINDAFAMEMFNAAEECGLMLELDKPN